MVQMPLSVDIEKGPMVLNVSPLQSLVYNLLNQIGEHPQREGLVRTPERFEKALRELTSGYSMSAQEAVGEGVFESEGSGLISVNDLEFFSLCEHHMLPFWGHVSISYLPNDKILGLSKLGRVVDVFSKRLQVQERLTREVAESIHQLVDAKAVFVRVEAQHMCMMMRGVKKISSNTRTEFGIGIEDLTPYEKERILEGVRK